MKELPLDKIAEIEAALSQHFSLLNLVVMLYWRYIKPYKIIYIYLSISKGYNAKVAYFSAWYGNKKDIYDRINKLKSR